MKNPKAKTTGMVGMLGIFFFLWKFRCRGGVRENQVTSSRFLPLSHLRNPYSLELMTPTSPVPRLFGLK